jgi:hypothetical protein
MTAYARAEHFLTVIGPVTSFSQITIKTMMGLKKGQRAIEPPLKLRVLCRMGLLAVVSLFGTSLRKKEPQTTLMYLLRYE